MLEGMIDGEDSLSSYNVVTILRDCLEVKHNSSSWDWLFEAKHIFGCALLLCTIIFFLLQHHYFSIIILSIRLVGTKIVLRYCQRTTLVALHIATNFSMQHVVSEWCLVWATKQQASCPYGPPIASHASRCTMQFDMPTLASGIPHVSRLVYVNLLCSIMGPRSPSYPHCLTNYLHTPLSAHIVSYR